MRAIYGGTSIPFTRLGAVYEYVVRLVANRAVW
jgi:hypothetical protein